MRIEVVNRRGLPHLLPEDGETLEFQGFTVRRSGQEYHVRALDGVLTHIRAHAVKGTGPFDANEDPSDLVRLVFQADPEKEGIEPEQPLTRWLEHRDAFDRFRKLRALDQEIASFCTWMDLVTSLPSDPLRQHRIASGIVTYDEIPFLLRPGTDVFCDVDVPFGGKVDSIERCANMFGMVYLNVSVEVYAALDDDGITRRIAHLVVTPYSEPRAFAALPVQPLRDEQKQEFIERGRRLLGLAERPTLIGCSGYMIQPSFRGDRKVYAEGRMMIDPVAFAQNRTEFAEGYGNRLPKQGRRRGDVDFSSFLNGGSRNRSRVEVERGEEWMLWPYLPAFSFRVRDWGIVCFDDLCEVTFRTDAFDRLVFDEDMKATVRDLVAYHGDAFQDMVDGKSGGLVFLLAGSPGLGKTLTAEALAETLKRPLYSVSAGDLGSNAGDVEHSLREIMDLAQRWNAVLLLDEADIFLEARDSSDIARNALVSTFLRLLDYHPGVMILTTNRADNLDPAVDSRVTIRLVYPDFGGEHRTAVWTNLLAAAGVRDVEVTPLACHPLNGRQIKNAIRLAQTLARSRKEEVVQEHLTRAVRLIMHERPGTVEANP